jgi:hypothetical protein
MSRILCAALFLISALVAAPAQADWWKDESGKGRGGPPGWAGRGGEPPEWARGKGVWDGHFKRGRRGGPPPWAGNQRHRAERYPYHSPTGPAFGHPPAYLPYGGQHGYWPPAGCRQCRSSSNGITDSVSATSDSMTQTKRVSW